MDDEKGGKVGQPRYQENSTIAVRHLQQEAGKGRDEHSADCAAESSNPHD